MAYTPSTAAILRQLRREQGRPLREARHLTLIQGGATTTTKDQK